MYNKNSEVTSEKTMSPSKTLIKAAEKAVTDQETELETEFSYGNNGTKYYVHKPGTGQKILKKVISFFPITVGGVEYKIYTAQG